MSQRSPHTDRDEGIAIIGLGLRLPQSETLDEFWSHLAAGRSLITDVPARRWDAAALLGDPARGEFSHSVRGGFIEDADCFDPAFFNISPREAAWMDPQQRFALELAWKAIEDAGYPARALAGSRTGVYVGVCHWDYAELLEKHLPQQDAYTPTGIAFSIIANRVSHFFDLRGPSIANDTACAASLTSVYEAVRALQSGECEMALAGGVNLVWSPNHFISFSKNGMLSREGASRAFDQRADGYVRGEGGAMLLLKPLAGALADGDPIHAVIRGAGVNHGGRTNSLTVTNPQAQAELIAEVMRRAAWSPDSVDYIEAHGTGTPLGDPIEFAGLKQAYARLHEEAGTVPEAASCLVGSVKTNIGHLEGAAGVAGIVKVLAALRHDVLPANVDFAQLNSLIKLEGSPFAVAGRSQPWPRRADRPRRAAVSSFGFGGSNGHLVLEEPPAPSASVQVPGPWLLPLSARDPQRLRAGASMLLRHLQQHPDVPLDALAWTLQTGRESMDTRVLFRVADRDDLVQALGRFVAGEPDAPLDAAPDAAADALAALAERWLAGEEVDWRRLHAGSPPQRLHAPGYAFARERHWMDLSQGQKDAAPVAHPLLQRNVSRLGQQAYASGFSGSEFFWAEHRVGEVQVLPGVVALEMARAAWAHATGASPAARPGLCFEGVVWAQAVRAQEAATLLEIRLRPRPDESLAFEVSAGGPAPVVCVQGSLRAASAMKDDSRRAPFDLVALRESATTVIELAELYQRLQRSGMHHGPTFQAVTRAWRGPQHLLASLKLPRRLRATLGTYALHPVMLDAAIQAWVGWEMAAHPAETARHGAAVPFSCQRIDVFGQCEESMWAVVTSLGSSGSAGGAAPQDASLKRFDIALCDQQGQLRVRFQGLALRLMSAAPVAHEMVHLLPHWQLQPLPEPAASLSLTELPETRVVLAGVPPGATSKWTSEWTRSSHRPVLSLAAVGEPLDLAAVALQWYQQLRQALVEALRAGGRQPERWLVLVPASLPASLTAPLASLLRTVRAEQPRLSGAVVQVDGAWEPHRLAALLSAEAHATPRAEHCNQIRHDAQGQRWVLRQVAGPEPEPEAEAETLAAQSALVSGGGVVWITGGLGGVGPQLAAWLATRGVRRVVLSGRRLAPPVGQLEALRQRGLDAVYRACDVADPQQVRATVQWIAAEQGPLKGVVHAAGVLHDGYLYTKGADDVAAVFAPKVAGLLAIDEATRDLDLDFVLLCSSVAGVAGQPGQADYGAANAFMDAYAGERAARVARGECKGQTLAVAWPLWAEGGMQVDGATRAALQRRLGTVPMPTADGLAALESLLRPGAPVQCLLQYGLRERILAHWTVGDEPEPTAAAPEGSARLSTDGPARSVLGVASSSAVSVAEQLDRTVAWLKDLLAEAIQMDAGRIRSNRKLQEYGLDSILIVEMTNRMEEALGPLSKTLFFEHADLDSLAAHLVETHADALAALVAPALPMPFPAPAPGGEVAAERSLAVAPFAAPGGAPAATGTAVPGHDIAIVGLSLRVSGAADQDSFWQMLAQGLDGFEPVPASRWDHAALHHPQRDVLGKTVVQTGTFLDGIDEFDPRYFRISQAEAELMSPEVRLFLQSCVEAFEDAGYSRETLQRRYGGDVAVIVGSMTNEYDLYGFQNMLIRGSLASGSYTGTVPNMVSYYYGFTGPSYFLDTMCSAAATCVHEAVQMLRTGRCQMALAGGVSLLLHPQKLIATSQEHFTTRTAEVIRGYGMGADGTILGEGVGALVMKRLEDAERDGDHIYGLIKGTGISNAGVRNGFTVPSPHQQAAAIEKAWQDSGVDPRTIGYIEGHGSGTSLGDPIEVKALTQAFAKYTDARQFCAIGTVKSNVAHLLGAAALPGIVKVLMQMKHGMLAPSLHAEQLNPNIPFEHTPVRVQRELTPWPRLHDEAGRALPWRAGVTSIGAGGMNVHIVLEAWPAPAAEPAESSDPAAPELFVFSAMTPAVLRALVGRFVDWLPRQASLRLPDLAWTLQEGRNELPCRLAVLAEGVDALLDRLRRFLAGSADGAATMAEGGFYSPSILDHDLRVAPAVLATALAGGQLSSLAAWWCQGVVIDWSCLPARGLRRRLSLPAYPFERVSCWYPSWPDAPSVVEPLGARNRLHPFIGSNQSDLQGLRYQTVIHRSELLDYGWAHERRSLLLPLVLPEVLAALARVAGITGPLQIEQVSVASAVAWTESSELSAAVLPVGASAGAGDLQLQLDMAEPGAPAQPWARARLKQPPKPASQPSAFDLSALRRQATSLLSGAEVYQELAASKRVFTPYLEVIEQAWRLPQGGLLCAVRDAAPQQDRHKRHVVWPAPLLGAAWQALLLCRPERAGLALARMDELCFFSTGATHVLVSPSPAKGDALHFLDGEGGVIGSMTGLHWLPPAELTGHASTPQGAPSAALQAPVTVHARTAVAAEAAPPAALVTELRQVVAGLLKFPVDEVSPRALFYDLGFDSITLTRLAEDLSARWDFPITPAIFFQCEHIEALARYLASRLPGSPAAAASPDRADLPASRVQTVPDDQPAPAAPQGGLDLAIIGLAARLPGSDDVDAFFDHLLAGRDLLGPLPLARYGADYQARMVAAGFPLQGGFLQDVDRFDAAFFKTTPHEASRMDPQQRLMLETAWHAVEHAGYRPEELPADTGVFVGVSGQDYARVLQAHGVETDGQVATGNALAMVANRLSWQLNLSGPSEAIDTACSSSLVALLRAAEAVERGRCRMALVGGANLALALEGFEGPMRAGMLSPEGRCKSFSSAADGYVRGEGVVALVLKRRTEAERDGDRILGLLIGGAENHGGRAGSLTAPSATAQAALVRRAMQGIPAASIGCIETHGTGTRLGDPVEVDGLRLAYDELLATEGAAEPVRIGLGALKSSIGHLEAAAGLAGVAKMLWALRTGELPANLHCPEVNPYLSLVGSPFFLLRERQPWPLRRDAAGRELPRRAAVSSFGFGGSNAHVVLQAPPPAGPKQRPALTPTRFADARHWIPGVEAGRAPDTVLLKPQWQAAPMLPEAVGAVAPQGAQAPRRRLILVGDFASLHLPADTPGLLAAPLLRGDVGARYGALAEWLLSALQDELRSGRHDAVLVQLVIPLGDERELHEGLGAMLDTALAESPRLLGQVIGLPVDISVDRALALLTAEARDATERRVRHGAGQRQVRRWAPLPPLPAPAPQPWRAGGHYLITGGLGALGLLLAQDMARRAPGARLLLVGSAALDERRQVALRQLASLGAVPVYRQADVADPVAVAQLVQDAVQRHGSLHGVFHAAGIHRDSAIIRKTPAQLRAVLAPKVQGSLALAQACRGMALDQFVLFSSLSGALGNPGQADYAAANGFMDALAQREGGALIALNWPLWQHGGMQPGPGGEQRLFETMGQRPLADEQGLAALRAALSAGESQVAVVGGEGARIREHFAQASRLPVRGPASSGGVGPTHDGPVAADLLDRVGLWLRDVLGRLAGLPPQAIRLDEELAQYGIDSLMIGRLNDTLQAAFGRLSSALFFEHRTLRGVARFLVHAHPQACQRWVGAQADERSTAAPSGAAPKVMASGAAGGAADGAADVASETAPLASHREPIAVIGLSGRYPGAPDLATFWRHLAAGHEAMADLPADRWPLHDTWLADPDQAVAAGLSYARRGGFLDGFADFDPLFFRISPREALAMDPQERLFLMAAWAACEDAGYTRQRLAEQHGSRVGVFAGVTKTGYALHGPVRTEGQALVRPGTSFASVANRVSHVLDLNGPSMPVDTMCSSSLTAIHEACEHLAAGDCELAIVGGVNLYLHPSNLAELSAARMLSPDGVCRSFGEGANGFVPGEGVGCVLLKPLSRALADGDRIHALIRGSAVNHGGRVHGYTVPNPVAQRDVIRAALQRAGLPAQALSCIEAHGTGTELGDPVEFEGLTQVFGPDPAGPVSLGSVKSGIGHLEAAAGMAGLTKLILQMQHRQLVPTLHCTPVNPRLRLAGTPFVLAQALSPWQPQAADGSPLPRVAGVSSFGAGGANAHVIVEEWPTVSFPQPPVSPGPAPAQGQPIVLSARTGPALREVVQRLLAWLEGQPSEAVPTPRTSVAEDVRALLAGILGVQDAELDLDEPFDHIGLGTVQRQALRRACERRFDQVLAPGPFAWLDSIQAVADELAQHLPTAAAAEPVPRAAEWDLADLAWTLQLGREAMDHRLALVASSLPALISSLRGWLDGAAGPGVQSAVASEHQATLALMSGEDELESLLDRCRATGDLSRLLGLWVRGLNVNWTRWQGLGGARRPRILSLPTYPFARERYWPEAAVTAVAEQAWAPLVSSVVAPLAGLGPLLAQHQALEQHLARLARAELAACTRPGSQAFSADWTRWRTALAGLLAAWPDEPDVPVPGREAAWSAWGAYREAATAHAGPVAQIELAEACVRALPDLLAGRVPATAVMFPQGRLTQVEAVYQHNAVAARFNQRLARAVAAFVAQRQAADPGTRLRIFEIGAGTGGTTRGVIDALAPCASAIAEYCYTDVSQAFLIHGEREFAPRAPYLRTARFDVEQALAGQAVDAGRYDLVIAANVLHATREMRATLDTVRGLLAPGGLLLLNETSRATVFTHLTFGLLEGWWRFVDPERRLPGCPALAPASWRQVLDEAGLDWLAGTPEEEHPLGQQLVAATARRSPAMAPAEGAPSTAMSALVPASPVLPSLAQPSASSAGLRAELMSSLASTLNVAPAAIDPDRPFADYGLDSILGAEWVHVLRTRWGIALAQTQLFDSSTVTQLERHLLQTHPERFAAAALLPAASPSSAPLGVPPVPVSNWDSLPAAASALPQLSGVREPIAIVGMSGRFAGSDNIEQLWQHLLAGHDLVGPVRRFDLQPFAGEVEPGSWCDHGSFIDDVESFDAAFFNISGLEATWMDPQQRLFLEEAWTTLEHAGHAGADIEGRRCGVFVGCAHGDYQELFRSQPPGQAFWGNTCSLIPSRIAYHLNLKGPALAVDTACSSSLVAVHLACQSLWRGESELALAGGVFVQSSPRFYRYANQARMLSPSGRCAAFGAHADGIVPGEAVACLLLRPLSQALADGDTVHGLIVASGMNQDGATNGITAPSAQSQEDLIRQVYRENGIDAGQISLVEAHGTGTVLGDPIEHLALSRAYRDWTQARGYCALGSIKANIGHATTAAGVAGLVKVVLALQHQTIPPTLHAQPPNPALALDDSPFYLNEAPVPWPARADQPRLAAVSSFGFGGTNAHLVVQEPPPAAAPVDTGEVCLVPLSARSASQLRRQAECLLAHLGQPHGQALADIAWTLCLGRRHLTHRQAWVVADLAELQHALSQWLAGAAPGPASTHPPVEPAQRAALDQLARKFMAGEAVDLASAFPSARRRVPLPSEPYARKRYWVAEAPTVAAAPLTLALTSPSSAASPAPAPWITSEGKVRLAPLTRPSGAAASTAALPSVLRAQPDEEGLCRLQWQGQVDAALLASLSHALQAASDDESVRAVLLEGESVWAGEASAAEVAAALACRLPLVAAVPAAEGAGFLLALHCDFLVLAETGRYHCPAGLTPAQVALLQRRFGAQTVDAWQAGASAQAGEALRAAGRVVPAAQARAQARTLALQIAAAPRGSIVELHQHMRTGPQVPADRPALDPALAGATALPSPSAQGPALASRALPLASPVVGLDLFDDGVVVLRMLEREHRNTFTPAFMAGMQEAFALIARTAACKVVVLTGHDHYFACGGTREGLESLQRGATRFTDQMIYSLPLECELPVIAAMQGHAIGAGWSLGLFCDTALYAADSVYHSNYMWYGFTPGAGATLVFPHRLGDDLGREVLFSASEYKGRDLAARGSGLAVLPAAEVLPRALALARRLAAHSRPALQAAKQGWAARLKSLAGPVFERELAMHQRTFIGNARVMERIASMFPAASASAPAPAPAPAPAQPPVPTAPEAADRSRVRGWMASTLAEELMIDAQEIADSAGFLQLGLDSILAVTWIRKLNAQLGLELPATSVYAHPTFGALLAQVLSRVSAATVAAPLAAPMGAVAAPVADPAAAAPVAPPLAASPPVPEPAAVQASAAPVAPPRLASVRAVPEPVAIIGASGRFPMAPDLDHFWRNLREARDGITEVPASRWDIGACFDPDPQAPGKSYSKWMGVIDGIDEFDAAFFNITGREAQLMDPQQRLFLQHAWHAIEDAALAPSSLAGSRCGVFVGSGDSGYAALISERNAYSLIGSAGSILASRIAYLLDLRGPCIALDTACSTSLVALAQACDSLAVGNCDLALAGGACVLLGPEMHIDTAKVSMLSPQGRCHSFDHRADGFVPGEGVGVLMLKRLSEAERDGDPIRAVIRGWATNQDGRTNGITAPNPLAQADLIRGLHQRFAIDPASIGLIEAHGTGTPLGDPIEVEGLNSAFGPTLARRSIALGSVKSNVGHLLAAAGVAGAIKAMLALEHAELPPTLHFERANEHLALQDSALRIQADLAPWPAQGAHPRRAGVSAFGFSGTNAHLVLEEYRARPLPAEPVTDQLLLCVLSARSRQQLAAHAAALANHLQVHPALDLAAWAHTLQIGRDAHEFRAAALFQSRDELLQRLQSIASDRPAEGLWRGSRDAAALALFEDDVDGRELIRKWLASGQWAKLAGPWTQGVSVDWRARPGSTALRRLRLPGYPFAADRHWVQRAAPPATVLMPPTPATPASLVPGRARLHPLIDRNASTLERARFAGRFHGDEVYLSHHLRGAERLLLGLFYPEMARAAGELAAGRPVRALRHMVWGQPAQINGEPRELTVVLAPAEDGLLYRICPDGDERRPCHLGELLLSGPGADGPALPLLSLPPIGLALTEAFRAEAPRAMAVRQVLQADAGLWAQVQLDRGASEAMVIDPLMLDLLWELVAFHERRQGLAGPRFPHALAGLLQDGSLPAAGWVRLWRAEPGSAALNLLLADDAGRVCLQLDGLLTERVEALPALNLDAHALE